MEFHAVLTDLADRCPGIRAVLLMDLDGVPIEQVLRDPMLDAEQFGVEYARILAETQKLSETLECGAINQLDIVTERGTVILRLLGAQYFLAVFLRSDAIHGKGRWLARMAEFALLPELG